ncbi:MAG: SDR family oxidoreductase [Microbacteriaceae bacterium]|nr:MAG: SDR family oxidoreductase [Microbacteriaceae bacterium]
MVTDQVAFVTGAASGIGRQVALRAGLEGYRLVAVDRDADGLAEAVRGFEARGVTALAVVADVSEPDALEAAAQQARAVHGRIDLVVAAAGIEVLGTVADLDAAAWRRSLDVTLSGTFFTARATIASLIETRGSFVAISSDAGTTGAQGYAAYAAAKHGVVGLVRCMALDHGPAGVRSNVICPGFVDTPMARRLFDSSPEGTEEFYRDAIPLGRFATPDDVADVVLHLASSRYANGVVYALDGGSTAGYFVSGDAA